MIKPIKSKKTYETALSRVYELMQKNLSHNSPEYGELELLSILIEDYESKNFPIDLPDPIEAIKFRLDQLGVDQSSLIDILGSKSRVSEIMNRKRKLSINMIRSLNENLNIPLDSLIRVY